MQCARHPKVETELSCGRCETPICPRCAVFTDVGARCPSCAPTRLLPQFEVGPLQAMRGGAAALAVGAALGAAWGFILPGEVGLYGMFIAAFIGYAIAQAVSSATNGKAGRLLATLGATGVVVAYLVHNIVGGDEILPTTDLFGYIAVVIGGAVVIGRLRY
ncbi:MAG: B-box zinc finger protein [Dehalococcoidia bacterium]